MARYTTAFAACVSTACIALSITVTQYYVAIAARPVVVLSPPLPAPAPPPNQFLAYGRVYGYLPPNLPPSVYFGPPLPPPPAYRL